MAPARRRSLANFYGTRLIADHAGDEPVITAFQVRGNIRIMNQALYENLIKRYTKWSSSLLTSSTCPCRNAPRWPWRRRSRKSSLKRLVRTVPFTFWRDGETVEVSVEELREQAARIIADWRNAKWAKNNSNRKGPNKIEHPRRRQPYLRDFRLLRKSAHSNLRATLGQH
jgi:hypothetical protein